MIRMQDDVDINTFFLCNPGVYEGAWDTEVWVPILRAIYNSQEDYENGENPVTEPKGASQLILLSTAAGGIGVVVFFNLKHLKEVVLESGEGSSVLFTYTKPEGISKPIYHVVAWNTTIREFVDKLLESNEKHANDKEMVLYQSLYLVTKEDDILSILLEDPIGRE